VKVIFTISLIFATAFAAAQTQSGSSPHPTRKGDEQVLQQETFSSAVADVLVARIGDGLAGHNRRSLLSAFDKNDAQDYAAIKEQVNAIMEAYRSFRVHYTVGSSAPNPDGTATIHASFQIEQQPAADNTLPFRRDAELTLTSARTQSGWRIVSFSPLNFFIASQ
jgi:hypothetical protein